MTHLPGDRPERQKNFHDKDGHHIFPHPETYELRKSYWTSWDRRYAAHLDLHRELLKNPEPVEGDPAAVLALFEHIGKLEQIIAKEKLLILAIREKYAAGGEVDEKEIRGVLRAGSTVDEKETGS